MVRNTVRTAVGWRWLQGMRCSVAQLPAALLWPAAEPQMQRVEGAQVLAVLPNAAATGAATPCEYLGRPGVMKCTGTCTPRLDLVDLYLQACHQLGSVLPRPAPPRLGSPHASDALGVQLRVQLYRCSLADSRRHFIQDRKGRPPAKTAQGHTLGSTIIRMSKSSTGAQSHQEWPGQQRARRLRIVHTKRALAAHLCSTRAIDRRCSSPGDSMAAQSAAAVKLPPTLSTKVSNPTRRSSANSSESEGRQLPELPLLLLPSCPRPAKLGERPSSGLSSKLPAAAQLPG